MANVLFNSGSTYSYLSFASDIEMLLDTLDDSIHVSTSVSESIIITYVYRFCLISFMGFQIWDDFLILDMDDIYIILGITLLFPHYVFLNSNTRSVTLKITGREKLEWKGVNKPNLAKIISSMWDSKLVHQGCIDYLSHVRDVEIEAPSIGCVRPHGSFT